MAFQVITDPTQLKGLGKVGLLWFEDSSGWVPSIFHPSTWYDGFTHRDLERMCRYSRYAILLED